MSCSPCVRTSFSGSLGPSGSGKTTLLRVLLGLAHPAYGRIERRPGVTTGYVPQIETIDWSFPVTTFDVVAMAVARPGHRRLDRREKQRIHDALDAVGLVGLHQRHIAELSGGQQQRVFLARAIAQRPDLLVLDEPTSGVDVATRHEILHLLADLNERGMSIVIATHDINGLAAHLPRVVCFNRTVIADGPPAEVLHPYVLERTYGAPMDVLQHGGLPIVVERAQQ
jgi:zinc/manganese transport system ATP-binding protein